jgi:glycosyltransferase involved in cell wall biosynthesis
MSAAQRPTIAFVSDAVYPWNIGGKEVRYHELTRRLVREGFDIDVYTMHWWDGPRTITIDGVRFHAICRRWPLYAGSRRSILQALAFSVACFSLMWRRFDALEADHMPYLQLFPLRLVAWVHRCPMVVTWHELWGREYWRGYLGAGAAIAAVVESLALRLPDQVVAASPETGRRLIAAGRHPSTVTVVPNGIDGTVIDAVSAADDKVDVLYVGRLLSHKNVDVLLNAMARVNRSGPSLKCLIVGTGPERVELGTLASRLGLSDSVSFIDRVGDSAAVYALMKAAGVFVLPSVREGFGISVIEALACGVPVITSDHPDNHARLLVEHGVDGWVCTPDAQTLAAAIVLALEGPRRCSATSGRSFESYDWDRAVTEVARIYSATLRVPVP